MSRGSTLACSGRVWKSTQHRWPHENASTEELYLHMQQQGDTRRRKWWSYSFITWPQTQWWRSDLRNVRKTLTPIHQAELPSPPPNALCHYWSSGGATSSCVALPVRHTETPQWGHESLTSRQEHPEHRMANSAILYICLISVKGGRRGGGEEEIAFPCRFH